MNQDKICGTCKWHQKDDTDWACLNEQSEDYSYYTDYNDTCEDWEERE